jgi:hypothetical protein
MTRITGKNDINQLNSDDIISFSRDMAMITGVKWINGEHVD